MAFQFSELKIHRGPTLARETGQVVQLFQSLQTAAEDENKPRPEREEAQGLLEALYTRIQNRIEELEDFYVDNDADERSLLFEKQRMALRRLLHVYCVNSEAKSRKAANAASQQSVKKNNRKALALAKSQSLSSSKDDDDESVKLSYSTRKKVDKSIGTLESVKPIYSWEKKQDDGDDSQVSLDPFEQPMVTFDIVLTEQEFFTYTSRLREYSVKQRAKKVRYYVSQKPLVSRIVLVADCCSMLWVHFQAEIAHASRRKRIAEQKKFEMSKNASLQASGPYLDPQRLARSLRRSPQKKQWMDAKGLRPY